MNRYSYKYLQEQINNITVSGVNVTISGINGILAYYENSIWYVDGSTVSGTGSGDVTYEMLLTTSGDIIAQIPIDYITLEQLITTSGDIVGQIPSLVGYATEAYVTEQLSTISGGSATLSGVGGVETYFVDGVWYVDGSAVQGNGGSGVLFSNSITGSGTFSNMEGYPILHNLGTFSHFTSVLPASDLTPDSLDLSKIGQVYVEIGENQDIVYNTGDPTISGYPFVWAAFVSAQPTYSGTGGIIVTQSGNVVLIDGGSVTGGPAASLECLICDGSTVSVSGNMTVGGDTTVSGNLIVEQDITASSGTFTEGLTVGTNTVRVTPAGITFPDGTTATTKQDITGCSGTLTTVSATINATDSFPKYLFTLPAQTDVEEITLDIIPFSGGAGSMTYPDLETPAKSTSLTAAYTWIPMGILLTPGAILTDIELYTTSSVTGNKFKLCKRITDGTWVISNITVSGGTATFTTSAGYVWYPIDKITIPNDGYNYYLGIYNTNALLLNRSNTGATYGIVTKNWSGDKTGGQIGPGSDGTNFPLIRGRYATQYAIGDSSNNQGLLKYFVPSTVGMSISGGTLSVGTDCGSRMYSRDIYAYTNASAPDTGGTFTANITQRKACFENYFTSISGSGNLYVEQVNNGSYVISSLEACYQSSCTYYEAVAAAGLNDTTRVFLLPAGHILTSVSGSNSITGGIVSTQGFSEGAPGGAGNGYTFVQNWFNLVAGSTIKRIWINGTSGAGNVKIKLARYVSAGAYVFTDAVTVYHPATGEVGFDVNIVVPNDGYTYRIATYNVSGLVYRSSGGDLLNDYKSGDLTGSVTGLSTNDSNTPRVKVGYTLGYTVYTGDDYLFTLPVTGNFSNSFTYGPYQDVTPIYLVPSTSFVSSPPTAGAFYFYFTYYNPSYVTYTRGTATWQGATGSVVTHNLGTTNHFLFVSPQDADPGSWWVTKGFNQDYVYTTTLSGSGTFDWFIQR